MADETTTTKWEVKHEPTNDETMSHNATRLTRIFWVISYEQTTQTVHSEYSQPLSDACRAPCIASFQRWCARS